MIKPLPYERLESVSRALRARANDARLAVLPGLSDELRELADAFDVIREATAVLARSVLRTQHHLELTKPDYRELFSLAREAENVDTAKRIDRDG